MLGLSQLLVGGPYTASEGRVLVKEHKPIDLEEGQVGCMKLVKRVFPREGKLDWRTDSGNEYMYRLMRPDDDGEVVITALDEVDPDTGRRRKLWMTDTPYEYHTNKPAPKVQGRILIGGLGLGLVIKLLHETKRKITEVVVVDRSADVIELVGKQIEGKFRFPVKTVHGDLNELEPLKLGEFDSAYLDIWESLASSPVKWLPTVKKVRPSVKGRIQLWGEGQMIGQMIQSAQMAQRNGGIKALIPTTADEFAEQNPDLQEILTKLDESGQHGSDEPTVKKACVTWFDEHIRYGKKVA